MQTSDHDQPPSYPLRKDPTCDQRTWRLFSNDPISVSESREEKEEEKEKGFLRSQLYL
jgi:hypothetical protein